MICLQPPHEGTASHGAACDQPRALRLWLFLFATGMVSLFPTNMIVVSDLFRLYWVMVPDESRSTRPT